MNDLFIKTLRSRNDIYYALPVLYEFAREAIGLARKSKGCQNCIVELGVREGCSTIAFLSAIADQRSRATGMMLHSCDIEECQQAQCIIRSHPIGNAWSFTQIDSITKTS